MAFLTGTYEDPLHGHPTYLWTAELGRGSFGRVQKATHRVTGEIVAIKSFRRGHLNPYSETEAMNHRILDHPNIIKFKEVFTTSHHVAIVMEYANFGTLRSYMPVDKPLEELWARYFFQQLILALDYSHSKGVVNRDIKLENTLVNFPGGELAAAAAAAAFAAGKQPDTAPPSIKICDFGLSKSLLQSAPKSQVGTALYMAPEVLQLNPNLSSVALPYDGEKAEIWSCGIMLYHMLAGQHPFVEKAKRDKPENWTSMKAELDRVLSLGWCQPEDPRISADALRFVKRLLVLNPAKRISIEGIKADPWFCKDLPPNALLVKGILLSRDARPYPGQQTVADIHQIFQDSIALPNHSGY